MGYTYRRVSSSGWEPVSGGKVMMLGPGGQIYATSDLHGIYDMAGLPPGAYQIYGTDMRGRNQLTCMWEGSQSPIAGDIRECSVTVQ